MLSLCFVPIGKKVPTIFAIVLPECSFIESVFHIGPTMQ